MLLMLTRESKATLVLIMKTKCKPIIVNQTLAHGGEVAGS